MKFRPRRRFAWSGLTNRRAPWRVALARSIDAEAMDLQKFRRNLEMPREKPGLVIFASDDLHRVHRRVISNTRATVRGISRDENIETVSSARDYRVACALRRFPSLSRNHPPTEFILAPPRDLFFAGC